MAWLCIVENCRNSSPFTPKDCKMFCIPNDEFLCKQWLMNVKRQDLCNHSVNILHKNYRVCSDHFKCSMFSNQQRTSLLSSAVPTEFVFNYDEEVSSNTSFTDMSISDPLFSNISIATSTPNKQNQSTSINLFNYEEEVSFTSSYSIHTSSSDMSISDPLFLNNSIATSASLLQNQSTSTSYVPLSLSSMYSADSPVASTSTQSTQCLSSSRKRKFEVEIRERSEKFNKSEKKVETLTCGVAQKLTDNKIDLTSVNLFNQVCDVHLPPNLYMIVKEHVHICKRKL